MTVLVEAHLIGAQVEYKVVGDDLAEVRNQGHVQGEGFTHSHFQVQASIDGHIGRAIFGIDVGARIRIQAKTGWRRNTADAAQKPPLVHQAFLIRIHGAPDIIGAVAADVAVEIHAPLLLGVSLVGKAKDGPGQSELGGPPVLINAAFRLPNSVPTAIRTVGREQFIGLDAVRGDREAHPVYTIVKTIEPNTKYIGVASAIALDELMQDAVRCGVPHARSDVQRTVIKSEAHFSALAGVGKRNGFEFVEICLWDNGLPGVFVEVSIDEDGLF